MSKNLEALDGWLNVDTWHTSHPLDETRFHRAVLKVLKANEPNTITPDDVIAYINQKYSGKIEPGFLSLRTSEAAERFELLSEFFVANRL